MFKALVLSTFIVATVAAVNHGYDLLLSQLDGLVNASYGSLAQSDNPDLRQAGQEITSNYIAARQNY